MADDIRKTLLDGGFKLIPLKPTSKEPRDSGWQSNDYALNDLGPQVGIRLNDSGLIDVDGETLDFQWFWGRNRPDSFSWGRKGWCTHTLFRGKLAKTTVFKLDDKVEGAPKLSGPHGNIIAEVRAGGKYTMIPPSMHPDGDKLQLMCDTLPIELNDKELQAVIQKVGWCAGLSVFSQFYPGEGSRDDYCLGLAGMFIKAGMDSDEAYELIHEMADLADDEEAKDRAEKAYRADKRHNGDRPVAGMHKVAEAAGIPVAWVKQALVWMGLRKENPNGDGPAVFLSDDLLKEVSQSWKALEEYERGGNPGLYNFNGDLTRINGGRIECLNRDSMRRELMDAATFLKPKKKQDGTVGWSVSTPSLELASALLKSRIEEYTVPDLIQFSKVPMFLPDGRLLNRSGFDHDSGIFMALDDDYKVPEQPTKRQVRRALVDLWSIMRDFPFEHESDRAHTMAMMLEPFVRPMLKASPLFFITKPAAGSGASLMAACLGIILTGEEPGAQTVPKDEAELEKRLLSDLREGPQMVFLDNIENTVDSSALASALTAGQFRSRVLGSSEMSSVPVRCLWVGTGNNAMLSGELYRRAIDIRIDPQVAEPEARPSSMFRIPRLKQHVEMNRKRLVEAALTLVQHWVAQDMPVGAGEKASFEEWAGVMSGILESLNVHGFGTTPEDRKMTDDADDGIKELLRIMVALRAAADKGHAYYKGYEGASGWHIPQFAAEIVKVIEHFELGEELGFPEHTLNPKALSNVLKRYRGRWFSDVTDQGAKVQYALQKDPTYTRKTRWFVEMKDDVQEAENE